MKKLFVTSPLLPPLEEFIPYLERMWQDKILTNGGQFHQQLEKALAEYLGVKYVCLFSNGTLALLTALQTLRITGEVITTPYSFVATSHSLLWNDLTPVFADIDPVTFNIDPDKIEELITPKTTAILPVHCYGIPCDMDRIQRIADTYGLKVVYDAAHCFGVKKDDISILNYGDLSVLSFHATKVFNTFEGGAIICHDEKTKQRIDFLKNFGFADETVVMAAGINAKMNEVQAAFGLLQLNYIDKALSDRADLYHNYVRLIDSKIPDIGYIVERNDITWNYAYFPIFIKEGGVVSRDEIYHELRNHGIYGRRYFYPLITSFSMYRQFPTANVNNLAVADRVSREVICLPIYPGLTPEQQEEIINVILELYLKKKQPATLGAVVELS